MGTIVCMSLSHTVDNCGNGETENFWPIVIRYFFIVNKSTFEKVYILFFSLEKRAGQ